MVIQGVTGWSCHLSLHWLLVRFRILFKIKFLSYKTLLEEQPVYLCSMLAAPLPSRSLRSNKDNSLSVPRVKTNTGARTFRSCAPLVSVEQPAAVCLFSHFSCYLQETSEDTSLWLGLSFIDTGMPDGLLLQNCFFNFAVKPWFTCRTTEPGFARDISALEIWLIDSFSHFKGYTEITTWGIIMDKMAHNSFIFFPFQLCSISILHFRKRIFTLQYFLPPQTPPKKKHKNNSRKEHCKNIFRDRTGKVLYTNAIVPGGGFDWITGWGLYVQ